MLPGHGDIWSDEEERRWTHGETEYLDLIDIEDDVDGIEQMSESELKEIVEKAVGIYPYSAVYHPGYLSIGYIA